MTGGEGSTSRNAALLRLLTWLSPAFPTGAFAYSHGLEWAVENGGVHDGATLQAWLEDVLRHGTGRTDAILFRHAHVGVDVAVLGRAAQTGRERLAETVGQGDAFVRAASAWPALTPILSQKERERLPSPSPSAPLPVNTRSIRTWPVRRCCRRLPRT